MQQNYDAKPFVINSPVELGQKLYSVGHGNRVTPLEWEVIYIGISCVTFDIHLVRYEHGIFAQSISIPATWLGCNYFYTAEEAQQLINQKINQKRKKEV